jgi:hypothetical protein
MFLDHQPRGKAHMRNFFTVSVAAIVLSGCAHFMNDQYTPVAGGPGTQAKVKADARECRDEASNTYLWKQGHGAALIGVVASGAVGGAAGGALAGGSVSQVSNKEPTLDEMIQTCMAKRGYTGFSEH